MALPNGNSERVRTGPGRVLMAAYGTALPNDFGAAGVLPTYDAALLEIGYTIDGIELELARETAGVTVNERTRAIRNELTGEEATVRVTFAELSADNLRRATGAAASAITTTANGATRFAFPKGGTIQRFSLVWEAEDGLDLLVVAKLFPTGTITIPRRRDPGAPAAIPVEFRVEENFDADLLGGDDIIQLFAPDYGDTDA